MKKTSTVRRCGEVELALNKHPAVLEAVVLERRDVHGNHRTIAYIVPSDVRLIDTLGPTQEDGSPGQSMPDSYVFVSSLPMTADGKTDAEELSRIEVIDPILIGQWGKLIAENDDISQIELLPAERIASVGSTHRLDLLRGIPGPDERVTAGSLNETVSSAEATQNGHCDDPAISHGAALVLPECYPKTLVQALRRSAEQYPENGVTYVKIDGTESFQTYAQLLAEAEEIHAGLLHLGQKTGDKIVFQLSDNREFLLAFWGCLLGGMVPVPVSIAPIYMSSNATVQKLINVWQSLEKPLVLASRELVPELQSVLNPSGTECARIEALDCLKQYGAMPEGVVEAEKLTLLLLTSGSTGLPKMVMHSHQTLVHRSASSISFNHFRDNDVSLNWMPLDHVGGIVMFHLRDVLSGGMQIQAATGWILEDPLRWLDIIEQYKVTISWAPNFAYALVADRTEDLASKQWDLSSMRHFLNAGEAVVARTARRFLKLLAAHGLAATVMKPAWGMSETASAITDSHDFSLATTSSDDHTVEVGKPNPGISLRIVDDNNKLMNGGEKGDLQVKGPSIMMGYLQNPEANQKSFTSDGWLDTGDVGFMRNGCLTVTARTKDEIIINGINYPAAEIEEVVDSIKGVEVSFSAACAVRRSESETDELAIFCIPSVSGDEQLAEVIRTIRERVATNVGIKPSYVIPLSDKIQIPKTTIGKIQRARLREGFKNKEYEEELRRSDLLTDTNTIPDWFFRKVWVRKESAPQLALSEVGTSLVFADTLGLGDRVRDRLKESGQSCIVVAAGGSFEKLGPDRYRLNPRNSGHYQDLIESIDSLGQRIEQVLHFWTYTEAAGASSSSVEALRQAQFQGLFSLLFLVQALVRVQGEDEQPLRMLVFGSHTQMTSESDSCTCEHATAIGLLKTIPLETPWLGCRHIDLQLESPEVNAQHVLREMQILNSEDEVAYRESHRLVRGLSEVDLGDIAPRKMPLKQGGVYLVTGGLGGIGSSLARFLIKQCKARLILVGATTLPDQSEWASHAGRQDKIAERLRVYHEIESMGQEFTYQAVDVSDLQALDKVVSAAEERWNERLAGVFHLASAGDPSLHWKDMDRHRVSEQSVDVFDSLIHPKVYGTWAIHELLKSRPEAINVSFGSVISLFGGATFSAYAAAQSFLSSYALRERAQGNHNTYCFIWSVWDEIGMSKGDPAFVKQIYRSAGYHMIPEAQGFDCMLSALCRDQTDLIIGLDASKQNVKRYLTSNAQSWQKLKAFYTTRNSEDSVESSLKKLVVRDSFGQKSQCEFIHLKEMPLNGDGEIDRAALLDMQGNDGADSHENILPRNETENLIAGIWHDVLAISINSLGIHENFFQVGGNSLSATRVLSRLRQTFQIKLSMRSLFEYATICELAIKVQQEQQLQTVNGDTRVVESMDPEILLGNVDQMSDEEVAGLLARMQGEESR